MNSTFWSSPRGFVALLFIASISYFLLMEHRQHLFEWLPYLIILLCPLMHLFMHHGHGDHKEDASKSMTTEQESRAVNGFDPTDSHSGNSQRNNH